MANTPSPKEPPIAVTKSSIQKATFWNTKGPKKDLSIGGGIVAGVGAGLMGVGAVAAGLTGIGTVAALWWGLNKFAKK